MNLIQRGRAMLVRTAQKAAGVQQASGASGALIYTDLNSLLTVDLTGMAWVGRTVYRSNIEGNASVEYGDRDYLIPAEALILGGVQVEPVRGNIFTETLEGVSETYKIISPEDGDPAWRWSDPQHTIYRVHCKQVS